MKRTVFALCLTFLSACPYAQSEPIGANITGPTEVGTSAMPPGQYSLVEKISGKTYSLTVTNRGNMILSPAAPPS
jgi:hypothetical protein